MAVISMVGRLGFLVFVCAAATNGEFSHLHDGDFQGKGVCSNDQNGISQELTLEDCLGACTEDSHCNYVGYCIPGGGVCDNHAEGTCQRYEDCGSFTENVSASGIWISPSNASDDNATADGNASNGGGAQESMPADAGAATAVGAVDAVDNIADASALTGVRLPSWTMGRASVGGVGAVAVALGGLVAALSMRRGREHTPVSSEDGLLVE